VTAPSADRAQQRGNWFARLPWPGKAKRRSEPPPRADHGLWTVDRAVRVLTTSCDREQRGAPMAHAVVVGADTVSFHLRTPDEPAPAGWTTTNDGRIWQAQLRWLQGANVAEALPDPYPRLVPLGTSGEGFVLLNLGQAGGVIGLEGDARQARALALDWARDLATSPWSRDVLVVRVGFRDDPAGPAAATFRDAEAALAGEAGGVLVLAGMPGGRDRERVHALAEDPAGQWSVVVVGRVDNPRWRFTVDAAGLVDTGLFSGPVNTNPNQPMSPVPTRPSTPESPSTPRRRAKWLVPALALTLPIAVAATTTLLLISGDGEAQYRSGTETPSTPSTSGTPSSSEVTKPPPRQLGPGWEDRGVIQDTQFPSTNRFWMVDINKDNKAEFVSVDQDQKFRFWWNGGPSGRDWIPFVAGKNSYIPAPGAVGNALRFGDVDGDDFPDCMVVDLSGRVTVHTWKADNPSGARMCMNRHDGGADVFSTGSSGDRPVIESTTQIRFADLTGDGRDDYLLIDRYGATFTWYNEDFVVTPERGSFLDWTVPEQIAGPAENETQYRYADINGDKRADRILLTAKGGARAWINEGAVGAPARERDIGKLAGDAEVPPQDIQFADIDGDGRADFLRIERTGVAHAWLNKLPATYFDTFHP
jgi:hypothetical protein